LSFRQSLLVAFLCIALLLSGALLRALLALQDLAERNRAASLGNMHLIEEVGQLGARSTALERLARQYLVLDDASLRARYMQAWESAREATGRLRADLPPALQPLAAEWLSLAGAAGETLARAPNARAVDAGALLDTFGQLAALNNRFSAAGKQYIDQRNAALEEEIAAQRGALTGLAAAAIALALVLAALFGLWLSRPLRQVQASITQLGEGSLQAPVRISGPADLRELGAQLDWLRLRLVELEDNKARFLRHVSHELKTPLAALREGVALLEDETAGELSDNQREVAGILRENTIALQEQIEGLLHFNASVFGARSLRAAPLDLGVLLGKIMQSQRMQVSARHLRVSVEGQAPSLNADAEKLEVVFTNLLSNAIRFSPKGGAITFLVEATPGIVRVDCIDEGPGVAPQDVERIFEPFQQGERQPLEARHGSGIGLAIVREFIAAHGGSVRLLPSARGAHFRVELPRDIPASPQRTASQAASSRTTAPPAPRAAANPDTAGAAKAAAIEPARAAPGALQTNSFSSIRPTT
jgi:two-component system sensor histidine kinase GlrK